ncbi:FadR/GntR family transcriptional regulator [Marinivivus vitaminiproducens]|uniref:FadR/GntR family transcriptional regulator n=1 Tax=Marinivivus vitaminiproducens TaxID=3035935 RepID=UPI00279B1890|nr:FadR/GntR family transcriptional regulator [Geminicoccaceae bacterium SCSIO 64248]
MSEAPLLIGRLTPSANLTEELARLLANEIESGKLVPGTKLPSEQKLVASSGVSRTVVREAIAALRARGLVVTRQGAGAFVAPDAGFRPFHIEPNELDSLAEVLRVMELRLGIEVEAAGLAAERRDKAQLATIRDALANIDKAVARGEPAIDSDFAFHQAIFAATGNPYFGRILAFLGRFIIPRQRVRIAFSSPAEQQAFLQRLQDEHGAIYEAIRARAPEDAREAVRRHLLNSIKRYRRLVATLEAGETR